jgi:hypothetical protein
MLVYISSISSAKERNVEGIIYVVDLTEIFR